jgi:formate hydrogenlyase subunit 3/multisubunit Na+/H+ antiporter MnhD subunit
MTEALLLAAWLVPLLLAVLLGLPALRATALALAPWAAMPALAAALLAGTAVWEQPAVLTGVRLGLDATGRGFLLLASLLWLIAGVYARAYLAEDERRLRFWVFFLVTQAGNLGLVLALDAVSFYLGFALMTFAAYGLVVHAGDPEALRAGRVYLVMAVLGEAALLVGLLLLVGATGSTQLPAAAGTPLAAALLAAGFGVKAGVVLLHMWLPLAHPVAPTPASAVLSGAMIKAGLLGWMRFLPLGGVALPELGTAFLALGLASALYGVAVGLAQRDPKTILAYSSVSQMGFMTLGVGAALLDPGSWPALAAAVVLYAFHHGLTKGALFLGVGVAQAVRGAARRWVLSGLALPALALAGAPLTSGALAKGALKAALVALPEPWPAVLAALLPLAAVGTTLLMARFLWVLAQVPHHAAPHGRGLIAAWIASLSAVLLAAWLAFPELVQAGASLQAAQLWSASWPVLVGFLAAAAVLHWGGGIARRAGAALAPGDVLALVEPPLVALWRVVVDAAGGPDRPGRERPAAGASVPGVGRIEAGLRSFPVVGALFLLALAALVAALARASGP